MRGQGTGLRRLACATLAIALPSCGGGGGYGGSPAPSPSPSSAPGSGLWATGYYPPYASGVMPIAAIPWSSVSHVVHFALTPTRNGTLADPDGLGAQTSALVSAAHAAGVRALLGIGGDESTGSPAGFRASAAPGLRASFVANIVAAMAAGGYDGVDVNWESVQFPRDVDAFRGFVSDLRAALDRQAPPTHFLLTYPAGTNSGVEDATNNANMLAPVQGFFDQINLQTYVMSGPYPGWVTWHNSPLSAGACRFTTTGAAPPAIDNTLQPFLDAGIDRRRIGLGVQLAGFDWAGGSGTDTGGATKPCQAWDYSGVRRDGSDIGAPEVTVVSAAELARSYTAANGFAAGFDAAAQVPYLSKDASGSSGDHFVSLENPDSIHAKGDYVKAQGLGGVIVFEITQDYQQEQAGADAQHPLMTAVRQYILH